MSEWIPTKSRNLPQDGDVVLIKTNCTNVRGRRNQLLQYHVATFCLGRSTSEVESSGVIRFADEHGNNLRPYRWSGDGPCAWFGQEVTHWMPLPEPPTDT
jgi:hypothetical protein